MKFYFNIYSKCLIFLVFFSGNLWPRMRLNGILRPFMAERLRLHSNSKQIFQNSGVLLTNQLSQKPRKGTKKLAERTKLRYKTFVAILIAGGASISNCGNRVHFTQKLFCLEIKQIKRLTSIFVSILFGECTAPLQHQQQNNKTSRHQSSTPLRPPFHHEQTSLQVPKLCQPQHSQQQYRRQW